MKNNKYFNMKALAKDIVLIDGISRAGKLMSGAIISSFKNMESVEFGENFEHFLPAIKLKKCSNDFAKSYLFNHLKQLIYNKMISRNINFRPSDRTGIKNYFNPKVYKKRLLMKEGDLVVKRILTTKPTLPFITHDLMVNYDIFEKLNINVKMIEIFRNPVDLVYSWYKRGLGDRWGKDPRVFTLLVEKNNKPYPWYLYNLPKNWSKLNVCEKCVYFVTLLTSQSIIQYKKINNKKKIYITNYEKIVENTQQEMLYISRFLNTKFSNQTKRIIKKENLPNTLENKSYLKKKEFIKKKVNKKSFDKLMFLVKRYNKNTYGLTRS